MTGSPASKPHNRHVVRVDAEVERELLRRRRPSETNHSQVIRRALEEHDLAQRLNRVGLGMVEMARLVELRSLRA